MLWLMLRAGVLILVLSWVPLLIAGFVLGMDNPIGPGLLAWAGSALGLLLVAIALVRGLVRLVFPARR